MAVSVLLKSLGNALLYESLMDRSPSDWAESKTFAPVEASAGQKSPSPEELIYSIISCLQMGHIKAAGRMLEEARNQCPESSGLSICLLALENWHKIEAYNSWPSWKSVDAFQCTWAWNALEYFQQAETRKLGNLAYANEDQRFFYELINGMYNLKNAHGFAEPQAWWADQPDQRERFHENARQLTESFLYFARQAQSPFSKGLQLWMQADLARRFGQTDQSYQYIIQAQLVFEEEKDIEGAALCMISRADWLSAPFTSPESWDFLIKESFSEGSQLNAFFSEKEHQLDKGKLKEARFIYEKARQTLGDTANKRLNASLAVRFAYLHTLAEDFPEAEEAIQKARQLFTEAGDERFCQMALAHEALIFLWGGKAKEAFPLAQQLGLRGKNSGLFSYTLGLGILFCRAGHYWMQGRDDPMRALSAFILAEKLFAALEAPINQAQSQVDQANVYQTLGDFPTSAYLLEKGVSSYRVALQQYDRQEIRTRLIQLSQQMYQAFLNQADPEGMQKSADQLNQLIPPLSPEAFRQIAPGTFPAQTNPDLIEKLALTQMVQMVNTQSKILIPLYKGKEAYAQCREEEADSYYRKALENADLDNSRQKLFYKAIALATMRRYEEARAVFLEHIDSESEPMIRGTGIEESPSLSRQEKINRIERIMSFWIRTENYKEAYRYYQELRRLVGEEWWKKDSRPWLPLTDMGELFEGLGQYEEALRYYDRALLEIESRRQNMSRDEMKRALSAERGVQFMFFLACRAATKAVAQSTNSESAIARAFRYAEVGKARALMDMMAVVHHEQVSGQDPLVFQWREINARLSVQRRRLAELQGRQDTGQSVLFSLMKEIEQNEEKLRKLEGELNSRESSFSRAVAPHSSVLSIQEIKELLPEDTLLIQFYYQLDDFMAWGISRDRATQFIHRKLEERKINLWVRQFHEACMHHRPTGKLSRKLASIFLEPFKERLSSGHKVVFIPYGSSFSIPFQALSFQGEPLSKTHEVSYLTAAAMLQFLHPKERAEQKKDKSLLVIGNPTLDLPAAEQEAIAIAGLFPGAKLLTREKATEERVRELIPHFDFIHIATHGHLSESNPLTSSLLLAEGDEISLYELMGIPIKAELVVLSACNTGQGDSSERDDVIGLTRGLLASGAQSALVSLWPVADASASLFMQHFYGLLSQGVPVGRALRESQEYLRSGDPATLVEEVETLSRQIKTRAAQFEDEELATNTDFSHPFHWAPFIYVGL
jgi:CHAT domain-containing protein